MTVPPLRSGMVAAHLTLFVVFIRELSFSILLATEKSTPMDVALNIISENETLGVVAAFDLIEGIPFRGGT